MSLAEIVFVLAMAIVGILQLVEFVLGLWCILRGAWRLARRIDRWMESGRCGASIVAVLDRVLPRPRRVNALTVTCWFAFNALAAWTAVTWFLGNAASQPRLLVAAATCILLPPLGLVWLMSGTGPARRGTA